MRFSSAIVLAVALFACDGEVYVEETPYLGARPPAPPEDAPYGEGAGQVFAIGSLTLGETGADWKRLGYNLDGLISEGGEGGHCRPVANVNPKAVHRDGVAGIDNAFGENILGVLTTVIPTPSAAMTATIAKGEATLLLDLDGLGSGESYLGITSHLNFGLALGAPAAFDESDVWPIDQALLANPDDPRSTMYSFPDAYVSQHVWVSGPPASFAVHLPEPLSLRLPLERAVITMKLAPDRSHAKDGTIAGIVPVDAFTDEVLRVLLLLLDTSSACAQPTIDNIREMVRQAADMPRSGVHDPDEVCDAISIGIGFSAKPARIGAAVVAPPPEEPCETDG